ncbi:condensin complex subunit 3-like isoform X2 [Haliotis rubra]|uniref:condensin complex subunit 3-like isoform X2 n=1 Tax=Haliotis rubra TaxID=36100 RepID=UPI001EE58626|nr:condensin complex subunit 3-like isoform X2 [Haliotis rubra]
MPQMTLLDVFDQCQDGMQCHNRLLKSMAKIYQSMEFDAFWSEFVHYLKYSMIVFKREAAVERTIDFVAKFSVSTTKRQDQQQEGTGDKGEEDAAKLKDESNKFLLTILEFLLQSHSAKERGVRFRCCQLINKLLSNLGDEAQIDDDLYDKIYTSMLERLRDKVPVVRMHAVLALSRLQDPTDENCPVIKAYLFLISRDPNPDVRRAVLSCIAPSTKTLMAVIERTRDVKDTVRRVAYNVVAEKIHIKALSIAQRIQLLQDGLSDRADMVKEACATKLLQAWLLQFQGSALQLLQSLDVEQSADVCQQVLYKLFEKVPVEEIVDNFDLLGEETLISDDKLTCESAMYWRVLCQFVQEKGVTYEEQLDKVLPSCIVLCKYVRKFLEKLTGCGDDFDRQLELEYIGQQILSLFKYMDLSDQAGRRELEKLLHDMMICDHVSHALMKYIISTLHLVKTNTDTLVAYLAETISEIREPITIVEKTLDKDERRQLDLKIASIRVRLNQAKEELEECVRCQEFAQAAELKSSVAELDAERSLLLEQGEPQSQEIRTEKSDPFTILKCLTVISELLTQLPVKTLTPTLHMLLESQVLPGVQNAESDVRNAAIKALGLSCLLKEEVVMQYLPLLIEVSQHDTETVKTTALQCLFDLVHMFGLGITRQEASTAAEGSNTSSSSDMAEVTADSPDDTLADAVTTSSKKSDASADIATKLVAILSAFLDSESSELRTVAAEGMAKLLLSGRVVSSKLLSHLLLLWYNPLTEDDNHLRHCLGAFLPVFAFACRANQELFEEAFMPTLNTLLNAPTSSPLNEVNVGNVGDFLVQLVNSKLLVVNQNSQSLVTDNPGHDHIAVLVCNAILSSPDSFSVKLWTRLLNQLDLSPDTQLKDMQVLCDQMLEVVKEKQSVKAVERFKASVESMLADKTSITNADAAPTSEEAEGGEDTAVDASGAVTESHGPLSSSQTSTVPDSQDTVATSVDITSVASDSQSSDIAISVVDTLSDSQSTQVENSSQGEATGTVTPALNTTIENTAASTKNVKVKRTTRAKSVKTPAPILMPQANKTAKSTTGRRTRTQAQADSELENSVFGSPTPLRGSKANVKQVESLEHTRRNLQGLLLEGKDSSQSVTEEPKTPRSKRAGIRSQKRPALTDVNGD